MVKMALHSAAKGKLISVIGDEVRTLQEINKLQNLLTISSCRTPVLVFSWVELEKLTKIATQTSWLWIKVNQLRPFIVNLMIM